MRRPRHKLQVSTFPFLAVLLCALGSLILLLLVMDRRAKLVARNKFRQQHEQRRAELLEQTSQAEALRQAEWERQKRRLHQVLLEQSAELQAQLAALRGELEAGKNLLGQERADVLNLQQQYSAESKRLLQQKKLLDQLQAGLTSRKQAETTAHLQLRRLTQEVLALEKTLAQLKAVKSRPRDVYSLIPYRGKHGDQRRPIYIECTRGGLVFHPERTTLSGAGMTGTDIIGEVQLRAGILQRQADKSKPRNDQAYVLFLVRPDGIKHYYAAQATLDGYAIDFGYELVEGHWTFDLSDAAVAANQRYYGADGPPPGVSHGPRPAPPADPGGGHVVGSSPVSTWPPAMSKPGIGPGIFELGSGLTGSGPGPAKSLTAPPGTGSANFQLGSSSPGSSTGTFLHSRAHGAGPHTPGSATQGMSRAPGPQHADNAWPQGQAPGKGAFPSHGRSGNQVKHPGVFAALMPPRLSGELHGSGKSPDSQAGPQDNPMATAGTSNAHGGSNDTQQPGSAESVKLGFGGSDASPGNGSTGGTGETGGSPRPSALQGSAKSPPARLSRILGNHDYIIKIDCDATGIILAPYNELYAYEPAHQRADVELALVDAIGRMIARKNATVRSGEPQYRPQIRLRVLPGGLRSYYWIYPVLGRLGIRMSRENVAD